MAGHLVKAESKYKAFAKADVLLLTGLCCAHQQWAVKVYSSVHPVSNLHRGWEAGEVSPAARGRQKFCLVLEARFPLGLSTALETSTREESAGQIGAGKKVQCKEEGIAALIYFLRQMRSFLPSMSQSWALVFFMLHYKCL